jgi:hypothetical protein
MPVDTPASPREPPSDRRASSQCLVGSLRCQQWGPASLPTPLGGGRCGQAGAALACRCPSIAGSLAAPPNGMCATPPRGHARAILVGDAADARDARNGLEGRCPGCLSTARSPSWSKSGVEAERLAIAGVVRITPRSRQRGVVQPRQAASERTVRAVVAVEGAQKRRRRPGSPRPVTRVSSARKLEQSGPAASFNSQGTPFARVGYAISPSPPAPPDRHMKSVATWRWADGGALLCLPRTSVAASSRTHHPT